MLFLRLLADGAAGFAAGLLSSWGLGGGSILMLYMTGFAGMGQKPAQGANLLFFLSVSAGALKKHIKNGFVDKKAAIISAAAGLLTSAAAAFFAASADTYVLKKLFGVFLLFSGLLELIKKDV